MLLSQRIFSAHILTLSHTLFKHFHIDLDDLHLGIIAHSPEYSHLRCTKVFSYGLRMQKTFSILPYTLTLHIQISGP